MRILLIFLFINITQTILFSENKSFLLIDDFKGYSTTTSLTSTWHIKNTNGIVTLTSQSNKFSDNAKVMQIDYNLNIAPWWLTVERWLNVYIDFNTYSNINFYIKGNSTSTDDTFNIEIADTGDKRAQLKGTKKFHIKNEWKFYSFNVITDFTNMDSGFDNSIVKTIKLKPDWGAGDEQGQYYVGYISLGVTNIVHNKATDLENTYLSYSTDNIINAINVENKILTVNDILKVKYDVINNANFKIKLFTLDNKKIWSQAGVISGEGCISKELSGLNLKTGLYIVNVYIYTATAEYKKNFLISIEN